MFNYPKNVTRFYLASIQILPDKSRARLGTNLDPAMFLKIPRAYCFYQIKINFLDN